MVNGSHVLEGYIPDVDATVVTRVLDAGKLNKTFCSLTCSIVGCGIQKHVNILKLKYAAL